MALSQAKVVDYTINWLEKYNWEIVHAHYPDGHHISEKYGTLEVIDRKFVDVVAIKGNCIFLIECDKPFKMEYFKKLKNIKKEDIKIEKCPDFIVRGVAFNKKIDTEDQVKVVQNGGVLLRVRGEDRITIYGKIPEGCLNGEFKHTQTKL